MNDLVIMRDQQAVPLATMGLAINLSRGDGMTSETAQPLIQHYDDLVRAEAQGMLEPLVESVTREYLLVDRNQAADLMSMSRTFFETYLFKTPQLKLIEHHVPGSKKVFYDPNELKQAVLSLMD